MRINIAAKSEIRPVWRGAESTSFPSLGLGSISGGAFTALLHDGDGGRRWDRTEQLLTEFEVPKKTLPDVGGLACTHIVINKTLYMLKNPHKNKYIFPL